MLHHPSRLSNHARKLMRLAVVASGIQFAAPAFADFACGRNFETYQVLDANLRADHGTGVRCVRFVNENDRTQILWYGEGFWGTFRYRHLGDAIHFGPATGRAVDIFGNGEDGHGVGFGLTISTSAGSGGGIPAIIRVGGPWNEAWLRMADGVVHAYTSALRPITACGSNLTQYDAAAPIDLTFHPNQTKIGTRCRIPYVSTWIGQGARDGRPYFHLGSFVGDAANPPSVRVGAFDLCLTSAHICNAFDFGALSLVGISVNRNSDYEVPQWDEEWLLAQ